MTVQINDVHALITYYIVLYSKKYNERPVVNRNKVKYPLSDMLQDMSFEEARSLLEYYMNTDLEPDLTDFCYTYDEVLEQKKAEEKHKEQSKALLIETKKSVQEFRKRFNQ